MKKPLYQRVLLKISGEALMGSQNFGHDIATLQRICDDIATVHRQGVEICLVVGGGNIFRGASAAAAGMERTSADYMGMLGTVINALALQNIFDKLDIPTRVQSAIPMTTICETYIRRRAIRHMEKGRIVIFAAGTGSPFFTTDTTAALRAIEMNCDVLLKGTQVDGVYSSDPRHNADATHLEHVSYKQVITDDLGVMDMAAITLSRDNSLPIIVFSLQSPSSFSDVMRGHGTYTLVDHKGH